MRRGGQTCLAKQNYLARAGTRKLFPVQLTMMNEQDWQPYPVDLYLLYVMTTHAYIYTVVACTLNSRLLSRHLGVVVGTLQGSLFSVRYGSVSVKLTRLRALCQGTLLTSQCV